MRTVLEARQQRGLELATTVKIVRKRNEWIVPSQSGKGRYKVRAISKRKFKCNCPDHETNGGKCKHIFAVQYLQQLDLFDPDVAKSIRSRCFKIYSTLSCRRFMSDIRDAHSKGYLSRVPHFNSICNYLENPELTPILYSLITETSLPLKSVEVDFAADSSGFTTSRSCDGSIINIRSCFPILLIRRPKISPSARFPLIRATEA